jgi:glycine cleavage system regulatory protein
MQPPLVLTVIGADRPGLVEKLAQAVASHGGNWLESRMCRLGGQFAGIVRILAPPDQRAALTGALEGLAAQGLEVAVYPDDRSASDVGPTLARLELVGQDRPGIVRQVAAALAARGINVEDLATECSSAPMSGESLFKAQARLRLPDPCDVAALQQDLERIAADLLVEINLETLKAH